MNELKEDHNQIYSLRKIEEKRGFVSLEGNKLVINYFSDANFFHESTHASQYYRGDLGFFKSSGNPFCYDIYDELSAYIMENAYSGMNNLSAINIDRIYNMSYFDGQQSHFIYKHLPKFSLGKNGSSYFLRIAYPQENEGSINKTIEDYVGDFVNFHK